VDQNASGSIVSSSLGANVCCYTSASAGWFADEQASRRDFTTLWDKRNAMVAASTDLPFYQTLFTSMQVVA
jgi:hypothetical protein